jgi:hypothetical protein
MRLHLRGVLPAKSQAESGAALAQTRREKGLEDPVADFGPEVVRVSSPTTKAYVGGEVSLDFMFWPWGRHVGLWVEPECALVFRNSASSGIGNTGGVLFGW